MNLKSAQNQFEKIYDTESDAIFRFCLMRVSNREQALDITQETFTRLWQTISDGKEITNNRAFIFTIAHRLIIDWYRKKKAVSLEGMENEETGEPYEPTDEHAKENAEMGAEGRFVLDSIKKLSSVYRQAVYLRFVEGLSPPEIGKILEISTNAASVRVNRGIEELRKITGYAINEDSADSKQ